MKEEKKGISSEEKLFNDIEELEEKILELKDLGEVEIAKNFQPIVDELKKKSKENAYISNDLKKDIYKVMDYLNFEIDLQYQFIGIIRETKLISERYNERFEEFSTDFEEKSTEELWNGIRELSEGLKINSEENPRLKAQQFNKAIAKQVVRILNMQAQKGEDIDLSQADEICSKEDLINALKDMLIETSENVEKKDVFLDMAKYLDEKSLENPEVWQLLSGAEYIRIVGVNEKKSKDEIQISKPKGIKYEGLGLEKLGFSVYTLGDINEDGEWINVRKEYGRFPKDFEDENDRVLAVEINGVKELTSGFFKKYKKLKKAVIGKGVKEIRESCFAYSGLESIVIQDSVEIIGREAFESCKDLKNVEIGKGVKEIPKWCFRYSGLEGIAIPDSVEIIGAGAFKDCKDLKNVEIGKGVKEIPKWCFRYSGLEGIAIPDSVEIIGAGAFKDCKDLKNVVIGKGVKDIQDSCFAHSGLESIVIPDNVEKIEDEAFAYCEELKKALLFKGWQKVYGDSVFWGCEELTEIVSNMVCPSLARGCNAWCIGSTEKQMRIYKRRDPKIPETTALKKSIKDDKNSNEGEKSSWENISDDIKELEEKVRKIYYLRQTTLANSYKARVDELRRKYTEVLNSEDIIFGSEMDSQILDELFALKKELNEYINGKGKEIENKQTRERYNRNIGEITTGSDEKSTEELWAGVRKIAGQLKIDYEINPRLQAQQFNKIIAKQVLRILKTQAKRGEEIDLTQAEEVCGKEDLLCAIKDKLIEMSKQEQSEVKKEKYLDTARYLDEESLKTIGVWQILSGVQEVKIVGVKEKKPKKEIEIRKPRFCFPQIKYEGLGLEKIPGISVYTLGDIDEETGEWINLEKKYGKFPIDFGDENRRVLQIEIKGVEQVENCRDYCNLRKVNFGNTVKKISGEAFNGLRFLEEVEFGRGINYIGYNCFGCTAIKNIYLPRNIESIRSFAFFDCKNLKKIEIGEGKKEIHNDAFWSTPAWLNGNVKISDNTEIIGDFSIFTLGEIDPETGERKNVRRVLGRLDEFPQYSDQVLEIEINDVIKITEDNQLKDYPNLERVVLGENVTAIGERAFAECNKLKAVEMSEKLKRIEERAFEGAGIKEIKIPDSVEYIGNSAFSECLYLENVECGTRVHEIPERCFYMNFSLKRVRINSSRYTNIADNAFRDCPRDIDVRNLIGQICVVTNTKFEDPWEYFIR